jgi:hypothetical protein
LHWDVSGAAPEGCRANNKEWPSDIYLSCLKLASLGELYKAQMGILQSVKYDNWTRDTPQKGKLWLKGQESRSPLNRITDDKNQWEWAKVYKNNEM